MTFDPNNSQIFESYVPVYNAIPEKWDEARVFIVEQLKKITNSLNVKEIGFLLDEELLSGKSFIPGVTIAGNNPGQFRQVLRKVINVGPLAAGLNAGVSHGITFDANFTLIDIWVAGTNSSTFTATNINPNDVLMNATQIVITSPQAFDRAFCVVEYLQEL